MKKEIFKNFALEDKEVIAIINKYDNLINKYSYISFAFDEDLKQEIILTICKTLTRNRM